MPSTYTNKNIPTNANALLAGKPPNYTLAAIKGSPEEAKLIAALNSTCIPKDKADMMKLCDALTDPKTKPAAWLKPGCSELKEEYATRIERTSWNPRSIEILDMFVGALTEKAPTVHGEQENTEVRRDRLKDAAGTFEWIELADLSLLKYGMVAGVISQDIHATVNKDTGAMVMKEDDIESTIDSRFITVFDGQSILDWKFAPNGILQMLKLKAYQDVRSSWDSPNKNIARYYIFNLLEYLNSEGSIETTPTVKVYEMWDDGVWEVNVPQPQQYEEANILPCKIVFAPSLIEKIASNDFSNIQACSHRDWDLYIHQHPHAVITTPFTQKRSTEPLKFSSSDLVVLDAGNVAEGRPPETLKVEAPTSDCIGAQDAVIAARNSAIDRSVGMNSGDIEKQNPASGVSIQLRFRTAQQRLLVAYAKAMESMENSLASMAGKATVQYPKEFSMSPLDEAALHTQIMDTLKGLPEAQRAKQAAYTWSILDRNKLTAEQIGLIDNELKQWKQDTLDQALGII